MLPLSATLRTYLVKIFGPVCMILTVLISIYHCYTTYNHRQLKSGSSCPTSLKLTFALILVGIYSHLTLVLVLDSDISTIAFCTVIHYLGPPSYIIYKLLVYLVLTIRAKEFFGNSTFAYSPIKLKIWQWMLITWSILNVLVAIFLSSFDVASDPNQIPRCQYVVFPPVVISIILLDLIGGAGSAYLLIRPMLKTHRLKRQYVQNEDQIKLHTTEFKRIADKQAMLSGISVLTTWIALIGVILTNLHLVFVSIDLLVSTLSVILMYSWNKRMFRILCCCCGGSQKKHRSQIDLKNIEVGVNVSNQVQDTNAKEIVQNLPTIETVSSASIPENNVTN